MDIFNKNLDNDFFDLCKKILKRKYSGNDFVLTLAFNKKLNDSYRIVRETEIIIESGSKTGIISGIGSLLRGHCDENNPLCELNGCYFATHFNNFYMRAPLDEIYCFLEDLALWGKNAIAVWYDMHSYTSTDSMCDVGESSSVLVIARLRNILLYARKLGMKLALMCIGNEGFSNTPDKMRAQWTVQNGYFAPPMGHYHVEICPSQPEGLDKILENRRAMLSAFADIKPEYLIIFPYDQGGCTCSECTPWGINGFIRTVNAISDLLDEIMPDMKIILSTWGFDRFIKGEWEGLFNIFEKMKPSLYNKIAFILNQQVSGEKLPVSLYNFHTPGNKPLIGFPEVSMYGSVPWGGFGTNATPKIIQNDFNKINFLFDRKISENNAAYAGQFQYSEGFFADINHAMVLALFSGEYNNIDEALYDYIKLEILQKDEAENHEMITDVLNLIYITESTLPRNRCEADGSVLNYPPEMAEIGVKIPDKVKFIIHNTDRIEECYHLALKLNSRVKQSKRWRIIYLRAVIDYELMKNDFYISDSAQVYFNELTDLYFAEKAYYVVYPPHKE